MTQIDVQNLVKCYHRAVKEPGVKGSIKHLFKPVYGEKIAVDGISFSIQPGEAVGYVGPNGAGKSTTIKILTGIIVPTSGSVFVDGNIPYQNRVENARRIGVIFGQRTQLWWDLPVIDSFRLLGDIYQIPLVEFTRSLEECIDLLDLGPLLSVPARQLSLGQRVRCDLAASILHRPPILFLDEPTIGLDIAVKDKIRKFIKQIQRERNVTILLTSHDLGDITDLCQRLIMIDQGKILFDGQLNAIREQFGKERIIKIQVSEDTCKFLDAAKAALPELPPDSIQQVESNRLEIHFNSQKFTAGTIAGRLFPVLPIHDLEIKEPSIEAIIRQLYTGELRINQDL